ncbi:MAG: hypothetical protein AUI33_02250 [Ignavibacteria bacterium 13_1_40CM_2_61_4]|nr:MAG: hypothetical protein AUI33_02250 [Ignavibacteria bacterium 13_1_40CM_2_61_4]
MTIHSAALRSAVTLLAATTPLAAQTSNQPEIVACYDSRTSSTGTPQGSGIVYRIKVPGVVAQQGCVDPRHTQFSWTIRHSALTGLGNDDHPQYLLTDGARVTTEGFAVNGGYPTSATIPATGAGTRFMWFAGKAALRAGHIDESHAALWDDAAIGVSSTALGFNSNASAAFSFACCAGASASNQFATVLGSNSAASGWAATAIGNSATASGDYSTAIGFQANTNGMSGATVFADAQGGSPVRATAPNSFVARAQRVWFGRSGDQPTSPAGYFTVDGLIASTTDGFKFPDGTVQTTAATGGVSGTPNNTPNTLVQRDANGGIAVGAVQFGDGTTQSTAINIGVVKHLRVTIVQPTAGGATDRANIPWREPFADANYTVTCSAGGALDGLPLSIMEQAKDFVVVAVTNPSTNALSGLTIQCIAIHDSP